MKLVIAPDPTPSQELAGRVERLLKPPTPLNPLERSIHFLRGVHSRSGFLPASFYSLVAASSEVQGTPAIPGYPGIVFQNYLEHTSFAALTLDCRKAFDDGRKGLTGAVFGRTSDDCLDKHAGYWSERASTSRAEALAALKFLRMLFKKISRPRQDLLHGATELEKRVGLMKCHADRAAAHLSLEDYAVHLLDVAHMVAALVFIGEIIRSFDDPWAENTRFNDLDAAAAEASQILFPDAFSLPMFENMDVAVHARRCWKEPKWGFHYITSQLPFATGWA